MKIRAWVPPVVCCFLLGACAKRVETFDRDDLPSLSDYYPLAVGNRWTYQTSFLGEKRTQEVEVLKQVEGYFEDSQGGQLTVDAFGVRDQKRYLLRAPLEPGRTWTNVVSVSSVEHYKVMAVWVPRVKSDFDGHSGIAHIYDITP